MNSLTPSEISDFERLEKVVEAGQKTFVEVGLALTEIKDRKLYRKDYGTFEVYCQQRWGWSRQRGAQLIQAANVVEQLPEKCQPLVDNERSARELAKLPIPDRAKAVKQAEKTGESIPSVVRSKLPPPPVVPKTTATKPPEPEPERDKTGWPIPAGIIELWDEASGVQTLLTAISNVRSTLRNHADDIVFAETNMSSAMSHLDQAYADIKTGLPYAVCPTCNGKLRDTCTLCKGRGFISEHRWETCVPREKKEIRFSTIKTKGTK